MFPVVTPGGAPARGEVGLPRRVVNKWAGSPECSFCSSLSTEPHPGGKENPSVLHGLRGDHVSRKFTQRRAMAFRGTPTLCFSLGKGKRQRRNPQIWASSATGLVEKALDGLTLHFASLVLGMTCRGLRDPASVPLSPAGGGGEGRWGCPRALQHPHSVSVPIQGRAVRNRATGRCLEIKKDTSGSFQPVLQTCTTQVWTIQHTVRNWGSS